MFKIFGQDVSVTSTKVGYVLTCHEPRLWALTRFW